MKSSSLMTVLAISLLLIFSVPYVTAQKIQSDNVEIQDKYAQKTDLSLREKFSNTKTNEKFTAIISLKSSNEQDFSRVSQKISEDSITDVFDSQIIIAELTEREVRELTNDESVMHIEDDKPLYKQIQDPYLNLVEVDTVWPVEVDFENLDGTGETICIADTGVDFTHPDLVGKNASSCNYYCVNPGACVIDCSQADTDGHGTSVAGIAAASASAGGQNGIAKGALIHSMKIQADSANASSTSAMFRAIAMCRIINASVVSISFGTDFTMDDATCDAFSPSLNIVINATVNDGIPVIAAAGNDATVGEIVAPACIDQAIAVGNSDLADNPAPGSNYDNETLIFAPGVSVNTTCLGGGYCFFSGTSASTPFVSGSAAITKQLHRLTNQQITPNEIETLLFNNGDALTTLPFSDHRRLNIGQAIFSLEREFIRGDVNFDGSFDISDPIYILDYLFEVPASVSPTCLDALDANDDGGINVADVVAILTYLFDNPLLPQLPDPFPSLGVDPTDTDPFKCF